MALGSRGTAAMAALAAAGGVGTGCWTAQEFQRRKTVGHMLAERGFRRRETPSSSMKMDAILDEANTRINNLGFSAEDCARLLFPSVSVKHDRAGGESVDDPFGEPTLDSPKRAEDALGCSMIRFRHLSNLRFGAKAEIAVRSENVGWIYWVGMRYYSRNEDGGQPRQQIDFMHKLVLLRREGADGPWTVKGGYGWNDMSTGATSPEGLFRLTLPDGRGVRIRQNPPLLPEHRELDYVGIWEPSGDEGAEVFRDLEMWWGKDRDRPDRIEILNRENPSGQNRGLFDGGEPGYKGASLGYDASEGRWRTLKPMLGVNIAPILNSWYEPFAGKLGRWREYGEYCEALSEIRGEEAASRLSRALRLCFSR